MRCSFMRSGMLQMETACRGKGLELQITILSFQKRSIRSKEGMIFSIQRTFLKADRRWILNFPDTKTTVQFLKIRNMIFLDGSYTFTTGDLLYACIDGKQDGEYNKVEFSFRKTHWYLQSSGKKGEVPRINYSNQLLLGHSQPLPL